MDDDVKPASDRKFRRVFPCLQTITPVQVMRRLPVIEHFIAVLDGSIERCENVHDCKYIKRADGIEERLR